MISNDEYELKHLLAIVQVIEFYYTFMIACAHFPYKVRGIEKTFVYNQESRPQPFQPSDVPYPGLFNFHPVENARQFSIVAQDLPNGNSGFVTSNQICRYFLHGNCNRGDRCNYSHQQYYNMPRNFMDRTSKPDTKQYSSREFIIFLFVSKNMYPFYFIASRYADMNLDSFVGQIFMMCKDQHGV